MTSSPARTLTIRLTAEEARRAELAARADGLSVNEVTRRALAAWIDGRRQDEEFLQRAREQVRQDARLIEGRA